jgi:hypothetical protein
MKSIKPGRGPSGMAFVGSIIAVVFGILWTVLASSIVNFGRGSMSSFGGFGDFDMPGAMFSTSGPPDIIATIFPLFGVLFVIAGIASAVYNYKNARGRDRFSIIDIVDKQEEGDQADAWIKQEPGQEAPAKESPPHPAGKFCTECGQRLEGNFAFCPGCGKNLSKG